MNPKKHQSRTISKGPVKKQLVPTPPQAFPPLGWIHVIYETEDDDREIDSSEAMSPPPAHERSRGRHAK